MADEARRLILTVTDEEIDDSIDRLAKDNHLDRLSLQAEIARQGLSWDVYHKMVGKQLLRSRLIQTQIRPKVVIGESDIVAAWTAARTGASTMEGHLVLTTASGEVNDLGWNQPAQLRNELRQAVASAQASGSDQIQLELDGSTQTLKILATRIPVQDLSADEKEALRQEIFAKRLEKAFQNWISELKSRHFIERKPLPDSLRQP